MVTNGKRFEQNTEKSWIKIGWCPNRLKDAGGFTSEEGKRFTIANICDFTVATPTGTLYIENKSFSNGSSFTLSNILGMTPKQNENNMKKVRGLAEKDFLYSFIKSYYLILDVKSDIVYCIRAYKILEYIETSTKKSLNLSELAQNSEVIVKGERKRTNSFYDFKELSRTEYV